MDYKRQNTDPDVSTEETKAKQPPLPTGRRESGPLPGESFPKTDEWNGKPVDANYATVPEDKEEILANLRKAGEEVKTRFGLEERGMPDADKAPAGSK